uniref:Integrase n=1 Tax=Siphoviridae sp. ct0uL16 TaxID=2825299 RepID=A0A8S5Q5W1_9CAUD|nr:MAG TPA: Integrase [Siphoviridae sp. ct0uL16]
MAFVLNAIVSSLLKKINRGDIKLRNPNGTGTVTKKTGRARPWLVYGAGVLIDGVYKRPYLGSFKTKKEAEQRRIEFYINPNVKKSDMTFKQIYDDFLKSARFNQLSKSSQDTYKASFKHCEKLYSLTFSNIRTSQLQECIEKLSESGKSYSAVNKLKILFSVLYSYALENDIVTKNYAQFIILPKIEQTQKRALSDVEIKKIYDYAKSVNKAAKWTLYLILSGWRISEMLELTRFNYDVKEKCFIGGKKTTAGKNRRVPVHTAVQWIVDEQLAQNGKTVFCMENGEAMTPNYFREYLFKPMLKELNLDEALTPHATRHTFATLLKRGGADDFFRKRLLGHSSGNITDDVYTHEDLESLRKSIEKVNIFGIVKAKEKDVKGNKNKVG